MRAHIFANGVYQKAIDPVHSTETDADLIIAADGGAVHCQDINITPHIIIGDLDSIAPAAIEGFILAGVEIIRHPTQKDATDLELALDLARGKGADEVLLFGVLGGRWDMSLSNVMLAASEKYNMMAISLINVHCRIHIVHGGNTLSVKGHRGQTTSLIPVSLQAKGVTTKGFEYPLKNATLLFGSSRGVSNLLQGTEGWIFLKRGTLLCVQELTAP